VNFSTDPALDAFADGLTEALVAELARAGGLRVASRTSSMHYKGARTPLGEIARDRGVDLVIEGSVVQSRGRIRIVAQLIAATEDEHLWAQSYDRHSGDVLDLQAEAARLIAQDVKLALTASPQADGGRADDRVPAGRRAAGGHAQ
jgi:TolB-like protein